MDSPHSLAHFKFKPVFGNAYKEVSNVVSPLSCCEYGIKGDLIIIAKKTQASDIFHGPVLTLVALKYVFFFCFFFFIFLSWPWISNLAIVHCLLYHLKVDPYYFSSSSC